VTAHPSSPAPTIRPASPADVDRLAALAGQLGYPSTPVQIEKRLRAIADDSGHAVFVAEQNGAVAGYLDVFVLRTVESEPRAEVAGLVVDENVRSLGVGRRLMEHAEEWARAQGCNLVSLRSNVIRARAHAFYERLGYTLVKTQKAFRKQL
jgi:GNAT superfamily N-acetyltransferase